MAGGQYLRQTGTSTSSPASGWTVFQIADMATEPANTVLAGPIIGADAVPTFRVLSSADVPAGIITNVQIVTNTILFSNIQQVGAHTILGNPTGSTANASEITLGAGLSFSGTTLVGNVGTVTSVIASTGLSGGTITSTGTIAIAAGGVGTTQLADAGVTYAKIQNVASVSLLGNPTGSPAATSAITLGAGLSFSGTTLVATGSGGTVTSVIAGTGLTGGTITTTGTIALSATGLTITQHAGAIGTGSIVSTTCTFDLSTNDWYTLTLAHTATTTLALSNATTGQQFTLILVQDGTGGCLVTWFSGIKWPGGTVPTLSTGIGKVDVFTFKCYGTNTYYGFTPGLNL